MSSQVLTVPFEDRAAMDVALVGGKCASLSTLINAGMPVPPGFAVTTQAYDDFIEVSGLKPRFEETLSDLDYDDPKAVARVGNKIRRMILAANLPDSLTREITNAYVAMGEGEVSVRSSTSVEDGADASFAGQQDTFLYVQGTADVLTAVKRCFASLWTDRALGYAHKQGLSHLDISMAVGVQRMVTADRGVSGVMFTLDQETGHRGVITVSASYGLGEAIVSGGVTPDEWIVGKETVETHQPILMRHIGAKQLQCVRAITGTRMEPVPDEQRQTFCMSDIQVLQVALFGLQIERHYGRPMDIEWAIDADDRIWILQARPETAASKYRLRIFRFTEPPQADALIATGTAVGNMIAIGPVVKLSEPDPDAMAAFPLGGILVTEHTTPAWMPALDLAAAVIAKVGGPTSHASIVAREKGIPAVVATGETFANIPDGAMVTVSCADGTGQVFLGEHAFEIEEIDPAELPKVKTKIMFNLADPALALGRSQLPNDGVGLLRIELMLAKIGIHPMALVNYPNIPDRRVVAEIRRRTRGYESPADFFVQKLAEGIGLIAGAFGPNDVIVRFSDLKTNEYRELLGGYLYEPKEENPMIAYRGAVRHTDPRYAPAFALECAAVRMVRDTMGLTNLHIMEPFIRTLGEADNVLAVIARNGLVRGDNGLKAYAMIEVPSNGLLAADFALRFDGFSFGSNDFTQLILGIDRDSGDPLLVGMFNEMDPAVLMLMKMTLEAARRAGIPCGICGQGPSDRPEFAAWLVRNGITSMSLLPDAVLKTYHTVAAAEAALAASEPWLQ